MTLAAITDRVVGHGLPRRAPRDRMIRVTILPWLVYGRLLGGWRLIPVSLFSVACVGAIVAAKLPWGRA